MRIPYTSDICIVCLNKSKTSNGLGLSEEHVIPAALGGILTCKFICKPCNDGFGNGFESRAKTDPSIRLAIYNLKQKLPALYNSIEQGQPHVINTTVGAIPAMYDKGTLRGRVKKLNDGTLMVPEELTHKKLNELLIKRGLSEGKIKNALERFNHAAEEEDVELVPGMFVNKRGPINAAPDFSQGELLDPLVCLKITYEFAALLFGSPVFTDHYKLNEIRRSLHEQNSSSKNFCAEPLIADKYDTFHGLAFEGNDPDAKFQIRLFGRLAYRVRLKGLAFNHKPMAYTHDLVTGAESLN
jgi:hypothetical protein